ncbi:GSCOCG00011085001-RA-CDS, partial [Cotesia congregata]
MVTMSRFAPTQVGNSTFVRLPKDIVKKKRAVTNIQNDDEFCFLWCVNATLHPPVLVPADPSSYRHFSVRLNYEGIQFPIKLNDIPKFEKMNYLSINVYGIDSEFMGKKSEKSTIIPLYLSNFESKIPTIHLLMIKKSVNYTNNLDNIESVYHFAWIHNLSGLITSQISLGRHKLYFCDRCLNHFKLEKCYLEHRVDCFKTNKVRMDFLSEKNKILKFKDFKSKDTVPFVVYADLECTLEPPGDDEKIVHKHVPHSIAYYVHCSYDNTLSRFQLNRSPDCINWFAKQLESLALNFEQILKNPIKMKPLTKEQQGRHNQATVCHICEKPITSTTDKVYDHCHFTGNYRDAAHKSCNVNYQKSTIISVVFHNLSGYDSHFIIKSLATVFEGEISLLPINKERYISFTKSVKNTSVSLRFIDSFRFMASSLEKLASYLDDKDKQITRLHYPDPDKFKLAIRKGVFPYEYIDSIDRLDEKQLPDQDSFYSKLTNSTLSDDDYAFAQVVWNEFNINTLGEYSDLYLKTDVLLLADVFENFRRSCFKTYNLDALHFHTAPGLSNSAMLKHTGVELELFTDPEMLLFIEKGVRGEVSMCANRHAEANNRYMGKDFDSNNPESYLMYYDVNNLYGAGMSMSLPKGKFEWV